MATSKPRSGKATASKSARSAKSIVAPAASGELQLFTSSEARRDWKKVTGKALAGEKVAILIGKRAVALRPVELTYAEEEYGVSETQLNGKAQEILKQARKERAEGKTGSGSKLL